MSQCHSYNLVPKDFIPISLWKILIDSHIKILDRKYAGFWKNLLKFLHGA